MSWLRVIRWAFLAVHVAVSSLSPVSIQTYTETREWHVVRIVLDSAKMHQCLKKNSKYMKQNVSIISLKSVNNRYIFWDQRLFIKLVVAALSELILQGYFIVVLVLQKDTSHHIDWYHSIQTPPHTDAIFPTVVVWGLIYYFHIQRFTVIQFLL